MSEIRVKFFQSTGGKSWHWHVRAANGEIVTSGEGYTREADAKRGFETAVKVMQDAFYNYKGEVPEQGDTPGDPAEVEI